MIYQMPCPGKKGVFVASSYPNPDQARLDLRGWAAGNGYQIGDAPRTFTVYSCNQQPRQWVLLESAAVSQPSDTGH